ncbi:hypothetical protein LX16_2849 [Stackebrandtia albiflava]|uniref:Uncharacterized protein n=1 Tax=Stackebrandtia albiflava TaxID=406432 RepID=A0A562V2K7_9ACTN|nr:hypothetical protein [Stackebrandtia albiflava]TWJ12101.1 hypothetical protein LX16_2849 [Stackebrandtia albiflava]
MNLTKRLTASILPKATGKAATIEVKCYSGCGGYGVYIPTRGVRKPGEKLPCC